MKLHRAITLVVMIVGSLALLALMLAGAGEETGRSGLLALGLVVLVAAVAGIAFSWRRYFPGRNR